MAAYAEPLCSDIYDNCLEYTSIFRPRIHKHAFLADHGSVQCHLDLYGRQGVGSNFGGVNAHAGNFTALCAPNCLPERLALIAYTIEHGFVHDDDTDDADDEQFIIKENNMVIQSLNQSGVASLVKSASAQRKSEVQAKIAAGFLSLDPVFGEWLFAYWKTFLQSTEDVRTREFAGLDDYLAFRVVDAAAIWTLALFRWGTGIHLTPDEERTAGPMNYAAYAVLSLTNDLFSWEKEYRAYIESNGKITLVNAVSIAMASKGLSEKDAKALVKDEIRVHEELFCQLRDQYKKTSYQSESILRLFELLEDSMAGNFIWSIRVPRYCQIDQNPYQDYLKEFGEGEIRNLGLTNWKPDLDRNCERSDREHSNGDHINGVSSSGNYSNGEQPEQLKDKHPIDENLNGDYINGDHSSSESPGPDTPNSENVDSDNYYSNDEHLNGENLSGDSPNVGNLKRKRSNDESCENSGNLNVEHQNSVRPDEETANITKKVLKAYSSDKSFKDEPILDPYTYINSLPSKNVRATLISALNSWYKVPDESLLIIGGAINFLHNASLMLDDIQDESSLRRGNPVTHRIFGIGQTINSATYLMNEGLRLIQTLSSSAALIYSDEMRNLHLGQGHDLHWSYHTHVPSVGEYIDMVDGKTGGLFRLVSRLMQAEATWNKDLDLCHFATMLGRHFQIRDDYQNLNSPKYTQEKGLCEDFDERKISFPVILAMQSPGLHTMILSSIFKSRTEQRVLSPETKKYLLQHVTTDEVFSQTRSVLKSLHSELLHLLDGIEKAVGIENWVLRLLVIKLDVRDVDQKAEVHKTDSIWEMNQRKAWTSYQGNSRPIHMV